MTTALKALLHARHLQAHDDFRAAYQRIADDLEGPTGPPPVKSQYYRWLSGEVGLPRGHHCRVLEQMFPGWTAERLFAPMAGTPGIADTVAVALSAPDEARPWGHQQHSPVPEPATHPEPAARISRRVTAIAAEYRLTPAETTQLAGLAGNVVNLSLHTDVAVGKTGEATVKAVHRLFNMGTSPVTKITRTLWFEQCEKTIQVTPIQGDRRISIQRHHDVPNFRKFACLISPAIEPGDIGSAGYSCVGGKLDAARYWRLTAPRYTLHTSVRIRVEGLRLANCTASEEHPDGSENSISQRLVWDEDKDGFSIVLTRDFMRPGQSVTVRWEVDVEDS